MNQEESSLESASGLSPETDDGGSVGSSSEKRVVPVRLQQMRQKMERLKQEKQLRKQRKRQMIANPADESKQQPRLDNDALYGRRQQNRGGNRGGDGGYGRRDNRGYRNARYGGGNGNYGEGAGGGKPRRKLKPLYLRKEEEYNAKMEAKQQQKVQIYNKLKKERQYMPSAEELREHRRDCDERRREKQAQARARAKERKTGWEAKARLAKIRHQKNNRERHAPNLRRVDQRVAPEALPAVGRKAARAQPEVESTLNARTLTDGETLDALDALKQTTLEPPQKSPLRAPVREAPELPVVGALKAPVHPVIRDAPAERPLQPEVTPERVVMLERDRDGALAEAASARKALEELTIGSPDKMIESYFSSVSEKLKEIGRKGTKEREEKKFLEATPRGTNEVSAAVARSGIAPPPEMLGAVSTENSEPRAPTKSANVDGTQLSTAIGRIPVNIERIEVADEEITGALELAEIQD
jgi:hypothetical protein